MQASSMLSYSLFTFSFTYYMSCIIIDDQAYIYSYILSLSKYNNLYERFSPSDSTNSWKIKEKQSDKENINYKEKISNFMVIW